jgi:hypothetical protein
MGCAIYLNEIRWVTCFAEIPPVNLKKKNKSHWYKLPIKFVLKIKLMEFYFNASSFKK